jgi:hypothetical protein
LVFLAKCSAQVSVIKVIEHCHRWHCWSYFQVRLADVYSFCVRRANTCLQKLNCRICKNSLRFQHCICAALYKVRCDPVQEGCDPGIDAWIARLCTPISKRYNTNQVETVALGPHERSARVTL